MALMAEAEGLFPPAQLPDAAANLVFRLKTEPKKLTFDETMEAIGQSYELRDVAFSVGPVQSEAGQNRGSAKILSFAKLVGLNKIEALRLFGEHYESVRQDPEGQGHANIRAFMDCGFAGLAFPDGMALGEPKGDGDDEDEEEDEEEDVDGELEQGQEVQEQLQE